MAADGRKKRGGAPIVPLLLAAAGRVWRFVRARAVLCVSVLAAIVTMAFVPPDGAYAGYIDVDTIICLFCILAVAGGLRNAGAFERAARAVVVRFGKPRQAVAAVVFATAVLSMFATNDMALIMMLPLAAAMLIRAGWIRLLPLVFVLQALAANLGGMIMPFGNPQNLYLYSYFSIDLAAFLQTMLLPFIVSMALVALCCLALVRNGAIDSEKAGKTASAAASSHEETVSQDAPSRFDRRRAAVFTLLFLLVIASVFRTVPSLVSLAMVCAVMFALDRKALARVDYALLLTFVCFFVFSGNMARIPAVDQALGSLMSQQPLIVSAGLSQVISNVPAAVLLSHFSDAWQSLLVGVNIGGAGTPVGSLASLIALQNYQMVLRLPSLRSNAAEHGLTTGRFLAIFSALNFTFLILLSAVCLLAG